jgi:hypothetical protein
MNDKILPMTVLQIRSRLRGNYNQSEILLQIRRRLAQRVVMDSISDCHRSRFSNENRSRSEENCPFTCGQIAGFDALSIGEALTRVNSSRRLLRRDDCAGGGERAADAVQTVIPAPGIWERRCRPIPLLRSLLLPCRHPGRENFFPASRVGKGRASA